MTGLTPTTHPVDLSRLWLALLPALAVYGAAGVTVVRGAARRLAARKASKGPVAAPAGDTRRRRVVRVLARVNLGRAASAR